MFISKSTRVDLPWLNPKTFQKKRLKLTRRLRLIVARIEYEDNEKKGVLYTNGQNY